MGTLKYLHGGKVVTVNFVPQSESPLKLLDGGVVKGIPLGDTGPIKILVGGKVRALQSNSYYSGVVGIYCCDYNSDTVTACIHSMKYAGSTFIAHKFFWNEIDLVTGLSNRVLESGVITANDTTHTLNTNFLLQGNKILKVVDTTAKWYSYPGLVHVGDVTTEAKRYYQYRTLDDDTDYVFYVHYLTGTNYQLRKVNSSDFSIVASSVPTGSVHGIAASDNYVFFNDTSTYLVRQDHTFNPVTQIYVNLGGTVYVLGAGNGRVLVDCNNAINSGIYDENLNKTYNWPSDIQHYGNMDNPNKIAQNGITSSYFSFISTVDGILKNSWYLYPYITVFDTSFNKIKDVTVNEEPEFEGW